MRLLVRILSVLALSVWAGSALAQAPEIISIGNEEILPGGFSRRVPGIDVDPLNQPHIAFDGGSSVVLFDKIGGSWINTALDVGGYGSGQYFNPAVQVTPNNIEFVSGVLYGSQMGIGVITRSSVSTSPSGIGFSAKRIIPNSFDVGNLSTDPAFPNDVVVWVSEGYWGDYTYDLTVGGWTRLIANGQMWAGHGGEKNAFWISKAGNVLHADGTSHGIWHAAIGGWDKWDSSYNNSFRVAQHLDPVTWANFAQYPSQNDDGAYVSVTSDNKDPQTAYITAAYAGVVMNIWNGSSMVFSPANLLTIDPNGGSGLRRFAPQLCPSKNGGCHLDRRRVCENALRFAQG